MKTPHFRMEIPFDHPWARAIMYRKSSGYAHFPYGSMIFDGTECRIKLIAVHETHFSAHEDSNYIDTEWRAYRKGEK